MKGLVRMFKTKKKVIALMIAASMIVSALPAMAYSPDKDIYSEVVTSTDYKYYEVFDSVDSTASLMDGEAENPRVGEIYGIIQPKLDAALSGIGNENKKITIELGKEEIIDFSSPDGNNPDDYVAFSAAADKLFEQYNIVDIQCETAFDGKIAPNNFNVKKIIFTIDNTDTVEQTIATLSGDAKKALDNINTSNDDNAVFDDYAKEYNNGEFSLKFLKENQENILTGIQIENPLLCFIKSGWNMGTAMSASAIEDSNEVLKGIQSSKITSSLKMSYLDITKADYNAFLKKADDVYREIIKDENISDAEKAFMIHNWIINNVKYGYKVDVSALEKYLPAPEGQICISDEDKAKIGDSIIIYDLKYFEYIYAVARNNVIDDYNDKFNGVKESTELSDKEKEKQINALAKERDNVLAQLDADINRHTDKAHTAYAPLMAGYSVCQGYSLLYSLLLEKAGIESGTVTSDDLKHQWSLVKLDDEWYHTDVTWDDPVPAAAKNYITINSVLFDKGTLPVPYQGDDEDLLIYDNFLCSSEKFAEGSNEHIKDGDTILYFPADAECTSDTYTSTSEQTVAVTLINNQTINVNMANCVLGPNTCDGYKVQKRFCYYSERTGKYYYLVYYINSSKGTLDALKYYESPFSCVDSKGEFTPPKEIYSLTLAEIEAIITTEQPSFDEFKAVVEKYISDTTTTVTIPSEDLGLINNTISVSAKFIGNDTDTLSVDNIGTTTVTVKANPEASEVTAEKVDAYLVYYGENSEMLKVAFETVNITADGETIEFNAKAPKGAVKAKIIILNSGAELEPVIKAISTDTEVSE